MPGLIYRTLKAFRHFLTADKKKTFRRIFSYDWAVKKNSVKNWAAILQTRANACVEEALL